MRRVILALLAGTLFLALGAGPAAAAPRPNILIFLDDDQSHPAQSLPLMPNVQKVFGEGGTEYTNGYVTTPQCCPSRASIFSGQYSHNTGINHDSGIGFNARESWQYELHRAGYYTGLIGKYFNDLDTLNAPFFNYRNRGYGPGNTEIERFGTQVHRFLANTEKQDARPWALEVSTHSPHYPWTESAPNPRPIPPFDPPPSYQETDRSDKDPAVRKIHANDSAVKRAYYGSQMEVQAVDREVRNTFNALRADGENRNTLAFFLSDNGFFWGEHGLNGKGFPYLEAVNVPFFVRWPGHVPAGAVSHRLVANIDIAPTMYQAAGIKPGYPVDGRSLLSAHARRWLLLEGLVGVEKIPEWWSFLSAHRQYIEWKDGFREYYNLDQDPWELTADNRDHARLDRLIASARECSGTNCP